MRIRRVIDHVLAGAASCFSFKAKQLRMQTPVIQRQSLQ